MTLFAQAERVEVNALVLSLGCILLIVLLGGSIVCAIRMKQEGSVRKCYLSFILFALGWLICGTVSSLGKQSGNAFAASLAGLFIFAAMGIPGVILAILGLSEVRRAKPPAYGRVPAISTLVMAGLGLVFIIGAFGLGIMKGISKSRETAGLFTGEHSDVAEVFQDLGFEVKPPKPWIKTDASRINAEAAVAYLRSKPLVYFIIIAEKLEEEAELDLETLVDVVQANLVAAAPASKLVEEKEESLNGVAGVRLVYEVPIQKQILLYRYWIHLTPTRAYQLIAWGPQSEGPVILQEAGKAFASFTLVPPK